MKTRWMPLIVLSLTALLLGAGCASTGAGGGDVAAAPAKVDHSNETGDNGLLTPRALQTRFVNAIGGEEAVKAHKSLTSKGKMNISAMGISGDVTIYAAAPNKFVMNAELGGMGSIVQGYNGEVGFSENPMTGPALVEGGELNALLVQADFYGPLNMADHYPTQETAEETEFAGQAAYKVVLKDAEGKETTQFYAKDSALLIGTIATQEGPMGEAEVTITMSDYKDFGGLMAATKTVMSVSGMEIENTVETVTYDDVDPGAFELPASIQALVNK